MSNEILNEGQTPDNGKPPDNELLDPFDPTRLRVNQNFAETAGVKKAVITVPVRKPPKESFVRVHPDPTYRLETAVLELKEDREIYLVDPSIREELATESTFGVRAFFTTMSRQGVLFLWPCRMPGPDGRIDEWSRSALEAAKMAVDNWVRVQSNMSLGAYEVFEATAKIPEPNWPEMSFRQILSIAFKDRLINTIDHPVVQRLRGEI